MTSMDATLIAKPNDGPITSMASILDERELAVLCMIYRDVLSEAEVGEAMGVSQQMVSKIRLGALATLRDRANIIIELV